MSKTSLMFLISLITACGGWTKRDTLGELSFAGVTSVDWYETDVIVSNCRESNTLIGHCGEKISPNMEMPASMLIHVAVSALLPHGWVRTTWQIVTAGTESYTLYYNHANHWWVDDGSATLLKK